MAVHFQVFSHIPKSKYGLFKAQIVSMANVASDWTAWRYALAGDTTAPTSPLTADITLTNNLAGFRLQLSAAWIAAADADISKIRWYVRVKANTNAETFSSAWQPTAILDPDVAFEYTPDTSASSYYDVWVLAQDIVGNYDTSPAAAQFDNEEATKIVNDDLDGGFTFPAASLSNADWIYSGAFSASDNDTVAWGAGTLTLSNGSTYSINAGNTGNMAALTYIYFDSGASTTAFQVTTTAGTAIGTNKILIASAQNNSDGSANAVFHVFSGSAGQGVTVMADNVVTSNLAAISGTMGQLNIDKLLTMTGDPAAIRGGQTAYDTGTGFYLGYNTVTTSAWKLSIGDSSGKKLTWNGSSLAIVGDSFKVTGTSGYIQLSSGGAFGSMGIFNNSPNPLAFFQGAVGAGSVTYGDMYLQTFDGTTEKSSVYASSGSGNEPFIILATETVGDATIQLESGVLVITCGLDVDFNQCAIAVDAGEKIYLEGLTGDTHISYANSRIEFYVNNVLEGYIDTNGFVST